MAVTHMQLRRRHASSSSTQNGAKPQDSNVQAESIDLPVPTKGDGSTAISLSQPATSMMVRYLTTICSYILFTLGLALGFVAQALLWILLFPLFLLKPDLAQDLCGLTFRFCTVLCLFWLNPFWSVKIISNPPKGYKPRRTILMVNHPSSLDPMLTARAILPWEVKFVYKASLRRVPLGGWSLVLGGDVPVHFPKGTNGKKSKVPTSAIADLMDAVADLHRSGRPICVFPEGMRALDGRIQPLKDGFFKYALKHDCEILPCAVYNTHNLWPMTTKWHDIGTAYFAFGVPFYVQEHDTVESLKSKTRSQWLRLLKQMPGYDPAFNQHVYDEGDTTPGSSPNETTSCKDD